MIYLFWRNCHLSDLGAFCIEPNDFGGELELTAIYQLRNKPLLGPCDHLF